MAEKSTIAEDAQRREVVARYAERCAEIERTAVSPHVREPERAAARLELQRMPRDAGPTLLRNRDAVDGRPRGHLRVVGLSRVRFRQLARDGELPGITTSSW